MTENWGPRGLSSRREPARSSLRSSCTSTRNPVCWCGRCNFCPVADRRRIPAQVDFDDYREVAGAGLSSSPFKWIATWVDGRSTITATDVQANVPIDAAKFAKPKAATIKTQ